jgi:uncharacterized protein YggE
MMRAFSCVLGVVLLTAGGATACNMGASGGTRTLSVHGSASVRLKPDRVAFSVGVETRGASVAQAFNANTQKVKAVLDVLKQQGVKPEEMQTSDLDVSTMEAKGGRVVGYKVSNQITVSLDQTDRVGALLQTAVGAGANQVGSLRFFLSDTAQPRRQGLELAYADAQSKAEALASLSKAKLGPVISATDDTRFADGGLVGQLRSLGYVHGNAVQAGTEEMTFNVSVVYELR